MIPPRFGEPLLPSPVTLGPGAFLKELTGVRKAAPLSFAYHSERQCCTEGPQTCEKMLGFASHEGNANQTHSETAPHTC